MPEERFIAVTYPPLYRAMRTLAVDSLAVFRDQLGDPPKWPQAQFYEVSFPSSGGAQSSLVLRSDYGGTLRTAWPKIATLPSYQIVITELKKLADEGKAVGHIGSLDAAYAFPILEKYVASDLPFTFQEDGFAKCYGEVEAYLSSTTVRVRMFLWLQGLKSDLPTVQLDSDHRLLTIDDETARRLWMRSYRAKFPISFGPFSQIGRVGALLPLQPGQVVLEVTFQFTKDQWGALSLFLKREMDRAVTALRLGHVGAGSIRFHDYEHVGFSPESGLFGFAEQLSARRFSYTINDDVAESLRKRWPVSIAIAKRLVSEAPDISTPLRIAIERFNSASEIKVPADQLLDYMMALEALCTREDTAVSYRVCLRVATLIGHDASERQQIFDLVGEAYRERSNLSHGRASKLTSGDYASARMFLSKIEEALLRTIHFFIQAENKKQKKDDALRIVDMAIATQDRSILESSLTSNY